MKNQVIAVGSLDNVKFDFSKKATGQDLAEYLGEVAPADSIEVMDSDVPKTKVAFATTGDKVDICYVKVSGCNIGLSPVTGKRAQNKLLKARLEAQMPPKDTKAPAKKAAAPKTEAKPAAKAKPVAKAKPAAKAKAAPRKVVDQAHIDGLQVQANQDLNLPTGIEIQLTPAMSNQKFVYLLLYAVRTDDKARQMGGTKKSKLNFAADGKIEAWLKKAQILADDAIVKLSSRPRKRVSSDGAEIVTNAKDTHVVSAKGSVESVLGMLTALDN